MKCEPGTSDLYFQKIKNQIINFLEHYFIFQIEKPKSTIGFKYPTLRDHPIKSPLIWLEGKRADDGAEGLWRIHDDLYDLTDFIDKHPGGSDWLELTKGTDITEAFEVNHLSALPNEYLKKYFVRKAKVARNSPFTFKDDGFYKVLKRRVVKELQHVPEFPAKRSKLLTDLLFFGFITTAVLTIWWQSFLLGAVSGTLLTMTSIATHNFFHQRDNFRMYYMGLTFMSYRDWRVSHVLSHHLYPNTVYDLEISIIEPMLQFMPNKKNIFTRYVSWVYFPIVYSLLYVVYYLQGLSDMVFARRKLRLEDFTPFLLPVFFYVISGQTLPIVLIFFFWIETVSSFLFGAVGLSAGHHHPDVFHDGDAARPQSERDWGLYEVEAVMDRVEITGSHFLALITFGDHALHHLFPTLDHGKLEYLYPILKETCREFGVSFRMTSQLECVKGQFRQLSRVEPNKNFPGFR